MLKNLWFWRILRVPWTARRFKPVNPKGNHSWIFIGRTDAEAETLIFWPPEAKNWLIWKDPDAGKDWGWEEKGMTEDKMVGWHHRLNGHEFEQALGTGDRQGGLACCSPWGCKESDRTEWLNWTVYTVIWSHNQLQLPTDLRLFNQLYLPLWPWSWTELESRPNATTGWLWIPYLTSLSFHFFIHKLEIKAAAL